uniref:Uncharacterized protein n=1 Tax=Oryza punctata TaxID=4537 RepID=A0A0E0M1G5_ORYPU
MSSKIQAQTRGHPFLPEFVHLIPTTFHGDLTSKRVNTTLPVSNVSTRTSTALDEKLEVHLHLALLVIGRMMCCVCV